MLLGMLLGELSGALSGERDPGIGHLQQLLFLLGIVHSSRHALALVRVLPVLGNFAHPPISQKLFLKSYFPGVAQASTTIEPEALFPKGTVAAGRLGRAAARCAAEIPESVLCGAGPFLEFVGEHAKVAKILRPIVGGVYFSPVARRTYCEHRTDRVQSCHSLLPGLGAATAGKRTGGSVVGTPNPGHKEHDQ